MEEFIHTACDKTIPNYRQSTTRKPTGKSIWNNNIAEATKNEEFEYVVCLQIFVFLADSEIIWYQRMTLS
jgi:hypothetical protein